MNDASATHILILAQPARGRGWEEILRGPHIRTWLGRSAIPHGERPEVILTDVQPPPSTGRDDVVVVVVGGSGAADVCLAADCTPEELYRTCTLLGEIVRLRRQEREAARQLGELTAAAMTDALSGLPNRRAWDAELARRMLLCGSGKRLCLAVLDLDGFKEVNDQFGHAAGDRLLQVSGCAIQANLRQDDFVARLGGDEFGLLIWASGEEQGAAIVDRVRRRVASAAREAGLPAITASAGVAFSGTSPADSSAEKLFLAADRALLAAKRAGEDRTGGEQQ